MIVNPAGRASMLAEPLAAASVPHQGRQGRQAGADDTDPSFERGPHLHRRVIPRRFIQSDAGVLPGADDADDGGEGTDEEDAGETQFLHARKRELPDLMQSYAQDGEVDEDMRDIGTEKP